LSANETTLAALVALLPDGLDDRCCIFAARPWHAGSAAAAVVVDEDFKPPTEIKESGLDYFLEVAVANEVLEAIANRQASPADRCDLLIYYAENDAYPNWIYKR
jgi:hypothetical protein